jgi:multiple sugar transport system ATP-binding protein
MAVVSLEKISKLYSGASGHLAVDNVDLNIADGEFMVLLGPSGCGKSTTLRMIAGLESITSGVLSIDGRVMNNVAAKDRDIAMVFQSYALYPHMSVEDNLGFGLRRRKIDSTEIERRVKATAELLGLADLLQRKPHALSGGQRQRVALGRAMVREPMVFLFDEPLSNLDAALRVNTRNELIKQHNRLRSTMIYVTHDQVEAMTMGTRICVMNGGRVGQIGAPLDVYWNPVDIFVARFLGSPPMNLFNAILKSASGRPMVQEAALDSPLMRWSGETLVAFKDKAVTVGIRAEDLHLRADGMPAVARGRVRGRAFAVEPLGAETILVVESENRVEWTARLPRTVTVRAGEQVELFFSPQSVYLFNPQTGNVIPRDLS